MVVAGQARPTSCAAWRSSCAVRTTRPCSTDEWIDERRAEALARVEGLAERERREEVASLGSELGFMAVVEDAPADGPRLRLCHCPLRGLVEATRMPCRVEIGFVRELLGEDLVRESYIPAGDASCSNRMENGR